MTDGMTRNFVIDDDDGYRHQLYGEAERQRDVWDKTPYLDRVMQSLESAYLFQDSALYRLPKDSIAAIIQAVQLQRRRQVKSPEHGYLELTMWEIPRVQKQRPCRIVADIWASCPDIPITVLYPGAPWGDPYDGSTEETRRASRRESIVTAFKALGGAVPPLPTGYTRLAETEQAADRAFEEIRVGRMNEQQIHLRSGLGTQQGENDGIATLCKVIANSRPAPLHKKTDLDDLADLQAQVKLLAETMEKQTVAFTKALKAIAEIKAAEAPDTGPDTGA